jgi:hypothetical protein
MTSRIRFGTAGSVDVHLLVVPHPRRAKITPDFTISWPAALTNRIR